MALLLTAALARRIDLLWTAAPWWVALAAPIALALSHRHVPVGVSALWLLGLATYTWSLAPGDTLLASIWGLALVASVVAGRWRAAFLLIVTVLVVHGLLDALSLNAFDLQSYLSGSVHYRLGQTALVAIPVAVAGFVRSHRRWLALVFLMLATTATFAALISGSRGVYVPLAAVVIVASLRLTRSPASRRRTIVGLLAMAAVIAVADRALPFHPVSEALSAKASIHAQRAAVATAGSFTDRLRFWDQGLGMALRRPFGVGLGGFRSTVHAYQRFPMLWSSSPHNVFVETVATTGWFGLILLVVVVAWSFWRGWGTEAWPWALALLGIWFTLSVDVTADYPGMMVIAFGTLGASVGPGTGPATAADGSAWRDTRIAMAMAVVLAGAGLGLWWFLPCAGTNCTLSRWRGVEYRVLATIATVPEAARTRYFHRLEQLYPKSLWVLQLELRYASTPAQQLVLTRRIAKTYPMQSWRNYLRWANLGVASGDLAEAKRAVRAGLEVFGPGSRRYPEQRADPAGYRAWLARAQAILSMPP